MLSVAWDNYQWYISGTQELAWKECLTYTNYLHNRVIDCLVIYWVGVMPIEYLSSMSQ